MFGAFANAQAAREVCGVGRTTGRAWKFCAYEYPNSSRRVLYHFHGIFGSERDWRKSALEQSIVARWIQRGEKPPIVVSISYGPIWLLTEKNRASASGLYEHFWREVQPDIERRILGFKAEENWILGFSMGGFNAAQIYFKNPGFYSRAAIVCAAATVVAPFASPYTVQNYIRRTGANPALVKVALEVMNAHAPDPADWYRHSPIELARANLSPLSKPLYVADGTSDEFGFHEAAIDLARWARERGTRSRSDFFPGGGHCWVNGPKIADFFVEPL